MTDLLNTVQAALALPATAPTFNGAGALQVLSERLRSGLGGGADRLGPGASAAGAAQHQRHAVAMGFAGAGIGLASGAVVNQGLLLSNTDCA
ncbi:hypothetical protein [Pseudomonas trivialis]|uniref:hypothetical protein n=1 Tax=Pseudomonas trivialis TaxID=200450 RepID=UPI001112EBA3|nr:hypothetical protein [Pseudomonas trivialis]